MQPFLERRPRSPAGMRSEQGFQALNERASAVGALAGAAIPEDTRQRGDLQRAQSRVRSLPPGSQFQLHTIRNFSARVLQRCRLTVVQAVAVGGMFSHVRQHNVFCCGLIVSAISRRAITEANSSIE